MSIRFLMMAAVVAFSTVESRAQVSEATLQELEAKAAEFPELKAQVAQLREINKSMNLAGKRAEAEQMQAQAAAIGRCLEKAQYFGDPFYTLVTQKEKRQEEKAWASSGDCDVLKKKSSQAYSLLDRYSINRSTFINADGTADRNPKNRAAHKESKRVLRELAQTQTALAESEKAKADAALGQVQLAESNLNVLLSNTQNQLQKLEKEKQAKAEQIRKQSEEFLDKNKTTVKQLTTKTSTEIDVLIKANEEIAKNDPKAQKTIEELQKLKTIATKIELTDGMIDETKDLFRDMKDLEKEYKDAGKDFEALKRNVKQAAHNTLLEHVIQETVRDQIDAEVKKAVAEALKNQPSGSSSSTLCEDIQKCQWLQDRLKAAEDKIVAESERVIKVTTELNTRTQKGSTTNRAAPGKN